jgi:predicted alpha/beta-fold hydrolase
MNPSQTFQPNGWIGHPHVQSLMTSGPWRRHVVGRSAQGFLSRTQTEVWRASDGTRLLGYRNHPSSVEITQSKPLVILIHGWEGSSQSNYLLSMANTLDQAGLATFRLNLRDHGDSHYLNVGLFHSCRLFEVMDVVAQLSADWRGRFGHDVPVYLVGFSLGGNFSLRVAKRGGEVGLSLSHAFAISPVIRPLHVMSALEHGPMVYHQYFVKKWRKSLKRKQALFPGDYDFTEWFKLNRLSEQTEWLIGHYTDYPNVTDYLEGYSVAGDYLRGLPIPTTILTAADDPIIPVDDFHRLSDDPNLEVVIEQKGGHCGFIENWRMQSWVEQWLLQRISGGTISEKTVG